MRKSVKMLFLQIVNYDQMQKNKNKKVTKCKTTECNRDKIHNNKTQIWQYTKVNLQIYPTRTFVVYCIYSYLHLDF